MAKKLMFWVGTAVMTLGVTTLCFAQGVSRMDTAKALVGKMCVKIVPDIETIPAAQHYDIFAGALASRGINNFVGKDANEEMTVGEMKEIYYVVTAAMGEPSEQKAECPAELVPVFAMAPEEKLSLENLETVLGCFPDCDLTAEPFTAPVVPPVPDTPPTTPEEPSSQIQ